MAFSSIKWVVRIVATFRNVFVYKTFQTLIGVLVGFLTNKEINFQVSDFSNGVMQVTFIEMEKTSRGRVLRE